MITRIKKSLTYIPSSLSEAIAYLTSIGSKQRDINSVRSEAKAKIEAINADAKKTIEVLTKDRDAFFTSLFTFSSAHKKELTKDTRSQKTSEGTFGWRWTTPYVDIAEGVSDEKVLLITFVSLRSSIVRPCFAIDLKCLVFLTLSVTNSSQNQNSQEKMGELRSWLKLKLLMCK